MMMLQKKNVFLTIQLVHTILHTTQNTQMKCILRNKQIIKGTLIEYDCMYHARHLPEYEKLKKMYPKLFDNRCNEIKFKNTYFIISDNGAYIRSKPSKNSKIIEAIPDGQFVELVETNGDWMLITSIWGKG